MKTSIIWEWQWMRKVREVWPFEHCWPYSGNKKHTKSVRHPWEISAKKRYLYEFRIHSATVRSDMDSKRGIPRRISGLDKAVRNKETEKLRNKEIVEV